MSSLNTVLPMTAAGTNPVRCNDATATANDNNNGNGGSLTPLPSNAAAVDGSFFQNWHSTTITLSQKALNNMLNNYFEEGGATAVNQAVQHFTMQSAARDGFTCLYATFLPPSPSNTNTDAIELKLTSPEGPVEEFAAQVERLFQVGQKAIDVWQKESAGKDTTGITFSLELGLPLTTHRCVLLLHYPPSSTSQFSDFLYAPTVSRWYTLLSQNGVAEKDVLKLNRIVDICPLVAGSTAGALLKPFDGTFEEYSFQSMAQYLPYGTQPCDAHSMPMMIFGGPVRDWVWSTYQTEIKAQFPATPAKTYLDVGDVFYLKGLMPSRPDQLTPCCVANHPSMYLYDTNIPISQWKAKVKGKYPSPYEVCKADLITAAWCDLMSNTPQADPHAAMTAAQARWTNDDDIKTIMLAHNTQFYPTNETAAAATKPATKKGGKTNGPSNAGLFHDYLSGHTAIAVKDDPTSIKNVEPSSAAMKFLMAAARPLSFLLGVFTTLVLLALVLWTMAH